MSTGEYIIFLNDDMIIDNNFIDSHVEKYRFTSSEKEYYVVPIFNCNFSLSRKALDDLNKRDGYLFDSMFNKLEYQDLDIEVRLKNLGYRKEYYMMLKVKI